MCLLAHNQPKVDDAASTYVTLHTSSITILRYISHKYKTYKASRDPYSYT